MGDGGLRSEGDGLFSDGLDELDGKGGENDCKDEDGGDSTAVMIELVVAFHSEEVSFRE